MDDLRAIFELIDQGGKGYITEEDLRNISHRQDSIGDIDHIVALLNLGTRDSLDFEQFRSKIQRIYNSRNETCYEGFGNNEGLYRRSTRKKAGSSPDLGGYDEVINLLKQVLCRLEDVLPPSSLASRKVQQKWPQLQIEETNELLKRRLEAMEVEKQSLQSRLDLTSERAEAMERLVLAQEADLKRTRQDLIHLTANFEAVARVFGGWQAEKDSLRSELLSASKNMASCGLKTTCSNAIYEDVLRSSSSLQKEREWFAQEKLAFSLERIAFDSYRSELAEAAKNPPRPTVKIGLDDEKEVVDLCIEACEDMDLNVLGNLEALQLENDNLKQSLAALEKTNASIKAAHATAIKLMQTIIKQRQAKNESEALP